MISKAVPARARTRTFAVGIEYVTEHTHQRAVASVGSEFEGGVGYATAPEKAAWIHARGVSSLETAALEMEATAALSRRCRDPVYHLIVAYAKHERPTREQVVADAERLLKAIGMGDHQYVLAAHKNTDDFHAHVIANRVGPDGRANDLWNERIIRERVCAESAAERGWNIVAGHHNRDIIQRIERLHDLPPEPAWRISDRAYRRQQELGQPPWHESARSSILGAVDSARSWGDLHRRLGKHGVVAKLVRRGDRVQGLAFAEGDDAGAPGCAASRIDSRCALSALQRRFGPFKPMPELVHRSAQTAATIRKDSSHGAGSCRPWGDVNRAPILAAVDAACSWSDLRQRLSEHGIVIKLVVRGGRVQGLAFAQGTQPDAPGCGASRIDPRCKKAVLEQRFGPFPTELDRSPGHGRSKADATQARDSNAERLEKTRDHSSTSPIDTEKKRRREADRRGRNSEGRMHPSHVLRQASLIADHARMRASYAAYRNEFFQSRQRGTDASRNAAWRREQAQRQIEAWRRRDARLMLRSVARIGSRGLARQIAYWSIEAVISRRRAQEHSAARIRWRATKIVLAAERNLVRKEKPMDYKSFATARARAGDPIAPNVLTDLTSRSRGTEGVTRQRQDAVGHARPQPALYTWTVEDIRSRLAAIRADEESRYDSARQARTKLPIVRPPRALDQTLAEERQRIQSEVRYATGFTDVEKARLSAIADQERSWNPLERIAAASAEVTLRAARDRRYQTLVAEALREFEAQQAPKLGLRHAADEQRYRSYVSTSLGLEQDIRSADAVLRQRLPHIFQRLNGLERAGVAQFFADEPALGAGLNQVSAVIEQQYRNIPETKRRDIERTILRERQAPRRSREPITMSGP